MKNYLVIYNYESEWFDNEKDAQEYVQKRLSNHQGLNPMPLSKSSTEVKNGAQNYKLTTYIYIYNTLYTETFTIVESEEHISLRDLREIAESSER